MKLIAFYLGSDARWLTETFPTDLRKIPYITFVKVRAWLMRPFVDEYWVTDHFLVKFIQRFHKRARIVVKADEIKYKQRLPKVEHKGFNILYYYPANEYNKKYCQWVYGLDIFTQLCNEIKDVKWIIVDGTQDLSAIYPIVDFYLRPNRHDGHSRMVDECVIQDIPFYWSHDHPNILWIKDKIAFYKNVKEAV